MDFKAIWKVLEPLNLPWVVYKQDRSDEPPAEAAAISRRYLKDALGIYASARMVREDPLRQ